MFVINRSFALISRLANNRIAHGIKEPKFDVSQEKKWLQETVTLIPR